MDYLHIFLRIVHLVAGVFWVGGTLMMAFFVAPTVGATAEAGQKFIAHLMGNLKFSQRMSAAAGLTVLAGALLYWLDTRGSSLWAGSSVGIGFGIGAVFAIIGMVYGIMVGQTAKGMAQLGMQARGKYSAEQMTQLQTLQKRQGQYSRVAAITLILAVFFMAIARFLVF